MVSVAGELIIGQQQMLPALVCESPEGWIASFPVSCHSPHLLPCYTGVAMIQVV